MKVAKVLILEQAKDDLISGKMFYDFNEERMGIYFYNSLLSDIESLLLYAGTHSKHNGLHRMMAKKIPVCNLLLYSKKYSYSCCYFRHEKKSIMDI